eukprot:TRINITY_DN605_c0_g1_i1.p1 TRINITY_DN605_c0_g1~~TRINITY_DN605_c0_g1_i1.p1  ORF type:complete len:1101 (+),score=223.18 TRINITY_DN605_c0_g1_i1:347-3304(+)
MAAEESRCHRSAQLAAYKERGAMEAAVAPLTNAAAALQIELAAARVEIEKYKSALATAEACVDSATKSGALAFAERASVSDELHLCVSEIEQKDVSLAALQTKLQEQLRAMQLTELERDTLRGENAALVTQMSTASGTVDTLQTEIAELRSAHDTTLQELSSLQSTLSRVNCENVVLKGQVSEAHARTESVSTSLQQLKSAYDSSLHELAAVSSEQSNAQFATSQLQHHKEASKSEVATLTAALQKLQSSHEALQRELQIVTREHTSAQQRSSLFQTDIQTARDQAQLASGQLNQLQLAHEMSLSELRMAVQARDAAVLSAAQLQAQLDYAKLTTAKLNDESVQLKSQLSTLQQQVQTLASERTSLGSELSLAQSRLQITTQQLSEKVDQFASSKVSLDAAQQNVFSLQQQLSAASDELAVSQGLVKQLTADVKARDAVSIGLKNDVQHLQQQLDSTTGENSVLRNHRMSDAAELQQKHTEDMQVINVAHATELQRLQLARQEQCAALQAEVDALKRELDDSRLTHMRDMQQLRNDSETEQSRMVAVQLQSEAEHVARRIQLQHDYDAVLTELVQLRQDVTRWHDAAFLNADKVVIAQESADSALQKYEATRAELDAMVQQYEQVHDQLHHVETESSMLRTLIQLILSQIGGSTSNIAAFNSYTSNDALHWARVNGYADLANAVVAIRQLVNERGDLTPDRTQAALHAAKNSSPRHEILDSVTLAQIAVSSPTMTALISPLALMQPQTDRSGPSPKFRALGLHRAASQPSWAALPAAVWIHVCSLLSLRELTLLSQTCHTIHHLTLADAVWRPLCDAAGFECPLRGAPFRERYRQCFLFLKHLANGKWFWNTEQSQYLVVSSPFGQATTTTVTLLYGDVQRSLRNVRLQLSKAGSPVLWAQDGSQQWTFSRCDLPHRGSGALCCAEFAHQHMLVARCKDDGTEGTQPDILARDLRLALHMVSARGCALPLNVFVHAWHTVVQQGK